MIKNFRNWISESREISREEEKQQVEKQLEKIRQWLNSIGFEERGENSTGRSTYQYEVMNFFDNHVSIYITTPFNRWVYKFDEKKVKYHDPYSRMPGQHYKGTGKNSWFVTFPGGSTRYNHQANTKQMSFNSFKSIFTKVLSIEKIFEKIRDFALLFAKDEEDKKNWNVTTWTIRSLTDITCDYSLPKGNIYYTWTSEDVWHVRFQTGDKWNREKLDPEKFTTTGLFYSSVFKAIQPESSNILVALQQMENEPIDEVWEKIKDGDWKKVITPHAGTIALKSLGL